MSGGILFETGAGGSAPKYFKKFIQDNHLSWDSSGEFLAFLSSLEHIYTKKNNSKVKILSESLSYGIRKLLEMSRIPSTSIGKLDSRGSHFYLTLYWSEALSIQNTDKILKIKFKNIYNTLLSYEKIIIDELTQIQGNNVNIGGYYHPSKNKLSKFMRPSTTFNKILKKYLLHDIL